jgi:hypothetical protein
MGEVYRADDLTLGQSVALKFLPESLAENPDAVNRFRSEVRIARQVSHPNVCRVHDVDEVDGQFFLSMEYVDGEHLASFLRRIGRLPEDAMMFHDEALTLGVTTDTDPPPTTSGSIHVELDAQGRLLEFRAMPVQKPDAPAKASMPDRAQLFRLAGLDIAAFEPAEPTMWTFLEASDTRAAWREVWPGSERPLRIEAAAFNGKPVVFSLLGPWARGPASGRPPRRLRVLRTVRSLDLPHALRMGAWPAGLCAGQGCSTFCGRVRP